MKRAKDSGQSGVTKGSVIEGQQLRVPAEYGIVFPLLSMNVAPFIIRYNYPIEVVPFGSAGDIERAEASILG